MSGEDTALVSELRNQKEVILHVTISALDHLRVHNAAGRRVNELTVVPFNEEPLGDPLVDNDDCQLRLLGCLVVDFIDCFLELGNLFLENLLSHGITNTISVDDEVIRVEFLRVSVRIRLESLLEGILEFVANDLLSSLLNNLVTEVLTHLLVD